MLIPRVIPCLLIRGDGLYKGERFKNHRYVGDPINAVHIFNRMEADELMFLDIAATDEKRITPLSTVQDIADECFMPFTVGGGIRTIDQAASIIRSGAEKVCINTGAFEVPGLIEEIANEYGNQSVVVSMDISRDFFRKKAVFVHSGRKSTGIRPSDYARMMEDRGAGELLVTTVQREGTGTGYDFDTLDSISRVVSIPVIASGGAGSLADFKIVLDAGVADAVSAGTMFVMHGPRKAVLIGYPTRAELEKQLFSNPTGD